MQNSRAQRKAELTARIADDLTRLCRGDGASAGGAAGWGDALRRFAEKFYQNVPLEDLETRSAEALAGAVLSLWQTGATRADGASKVRVFNPRLDEHGWQSTHTVIETVNDDMPFIVDSVVSELNRRDLHVHLTVHPVVHARRDDAGVLAGLCEKGAEGGKAESFMHIEIDEQGEDALPEIKTCIENILSDVRVAVSDWRKILQEMQDVIAGLKNDAPPLDKDHVAQTVAFLEWLCDNHFTFLGYRAYDFVREDGRQFSRMRENSGLGILRKVTEDSLKRHATPFRPAEATFANRKELLIIRKAYDRATVHRPVHMDYIGVRQFDRDGTVIGERRFLGLFTSSAYRERPSAVPMLREKLRRLVERSGFSAQSHDAKALEHVLESYPRDELYQTDDDELFDAAMRLMRVEERPRTALFVRFDPFERFISTIIVVPRDQYSTPIREKFQRILEQSFNGKVTHTATEIGDLTLARIHFAISTEPGAVPPYDLAAIEATLAEAAKSWSERLKDALVARAGEERGLALWRRYRGAMPTNYTESLSADFAALDIDMIEEALGTGRIRTSLYQSRAGRTMGLKMFHVGAPVTLSDVIPMLENAGLKAIGETPYRVSLNDGATEVWIHDFTLEGDGLQDLDIHALRPKFHELIERVWRGDVENDGFNTLVLAAGLDWRDVVVMRACCKYLRQAGIPFSETYMQETLARNPNIARLLSELVAAQFDVAGADHTHTRAVEIGVAIEEALETVSNLDEDRILRRFHNFFRSVLRTNLYQPGDDGVPKDYVSFKIDSRQIDDLPLPRPLYEVFVYSPRMEGIHLRGGKVARGGIRWSDRREDFRTEILGLMKAQMVKNAVIVPVGSKGGFVVKRPPATGGRDALMAEVVDCYKTLMFGLLDITDNIDDGAVVGPKHVLRLDEDDPYLVVAADKGTATFSDIANGVSRDYGFWLDDAFASGGSAGYDHKKMGITARGAWESVKRHFREMGRDTQAEDFTVLGVGDMSGDVFGNGMLRSRHIRLVGAFNHMHIFIDPDPDPEASFRERERLFALPRSSWTDYDKSLISAGGGIFERSAKSIVVSPRMKEIFAIAQDKLTPADLIRAMLMAEVDLLFFGGIGTYIKASGETAADAGDRANDAVRVDGRDVRAKVVGEGANLGCTQRGRVEAALAGVRLNTDAIDNSAGVDCSDHEVNIKIALGEIVAAGDMTLKQRDRLLVEMTDEVGDLVLRDNYLQTQALSVECARGLDALDGHQALMRRLERSGRLHRRIEFLPNDEEIAERAASGHGLTRPELAVLLGYAKLDLYDAILPTDIPDDPLLAPDLLKYFPRAMADRFRDTLPHHRLRREIIATQVTNSVINRAGPGFVTTMEDRTGAPVAEIVRAYAVTRDVFELRRLWADIEDLDAKVAAAIQTEMLMRLVDLMHRGTQWFLVNMAHPLDAAGITAEYGEGVKRLADNTLELVAEADRAELAADVARLVAAGVPEDLARRMAGIAERAAGLDVVRTASIDGLDVIDVAKIYFRAGAEFGFDRLRQMIRRAKPLTQWDKEALEAVSDDLYRFQSLVTQRILEASGGTEATHGVVAAWAETHAHVLRRAQQTLGELDMAAQIELSMLTVATQQLRALAGG